jgi:hypothetical protein
MSLQANLKQLASFYHSGAKRRIWGGEGFQLFVLVSDFDILISNLFLSGFSFDPLQIVRISTDNR